MAAGIFSGVPARADTSTDDFAFLAILAKYDVPEPGGDTAAITVAHRVCVNLHGGETPLTEALDMYRANATYTLTDAAHFVGAAIGAYCPDQLSRIDNPNAGTRV
jgi:hypothetical protein